jgi:predicted HicB family RNase H-like nuclease
MVMNVKSCSFLTDGNSMTETKANEDQKRGGGVVAFHVAPDLHAAVKAAAAHEGISLSDVARRALIRDLREREVA